jgi:hypothetical protein
MRFSADLAVMQAQTSGLTSRIVAAAASTAASPRRLRHRWSKVACVALPELTGAYGPLAVSPRYGHTLDRQSELLGGYLRQRSSTRTDVLRSGDHVGRAIAVELDPGIGGEAAPPSRGQPGQCCRFAPVLAVMIVMPAKCLYGRS